MNKEELFNSFCLKDKITQVHADEIMQSLEEFEKQIRLETLKEVLPKEKGQYDHPDIHYPYGWNDCLGEIINKALSKWGIIL